MFTFAAAVFFLIITPGPGVLSAAGVGAAYGMASGMRYVAGLCLGQLIVIALVVSGLSAVILAEPILRNVLLILSTLYLCFLAARIAFAGGEVAMIPAQTEPGIWAGVLLQPINPKAYAVNATLFTGFTIWPDAFWFEVVWKLVVLNAIWVPLHIGWVWFGSAVQRLDLSNSVQRSINFTMAGCMLIVVGLAVWAQVSA